MPDDIGPEGLSTTGIPSARRGLDRKVVERIMSQAASRWARLQREHEALLDEIEAAGGLEFFKADLAALARDMGRLLTEAEAAAEGIRSRAAGDAEERAHRAAEAAHRIRSEAEHIAFALRRQAWEEGTELLEQAMQTAEAMHEQADADVLIIRAEAEQEAHRRVAAARREGSEIVRNSRFEAERLVTEAKALAAELVAGAQQEADAAQERTRALEGRRRKLLEQMDEERGGSGDAAIRVIPPTGDARADQLGRRSAVARQVDVLGDDLADEVERLQVRARRLAMESRTLPDVEQVPDVPSEPEVGPQVEVEPEADVAPPVEVEGEPDADPTAELEPEPEPEPESAPGMESRPELEVEDEPEPGPQAQVGPALDPEPGPEVEPETPSEPEMRSESHALSETESPPEPERRSDRVADLFARLRHGGVALAPEPDAPETPPPGLPDVDAVELRDRHLLPIHNAGLRQVKQAVVEAQNVALDTLRVAGEWHPDAAGLLGALGRAVDGMVEGAAGAGAEAAGRLMGRGSTVPVIGTRSAEMTRAMVDDLVGRLVTALAGVSSAGPREVSAEVSRVFRGWRSEDAERWVGAVASAAYHDSLMEGLVAHGATAVIGLRHGRMCERCPAGTAQRWNPAADPPAGTVVPPAEVDCRCTVAPVD